MNCLASNSEFQCTKCESKYPQKTSLILHIASAHGLKCLLCEEKCSTMAELKVHFTSTHGLENANKNCTKPNFQTNSNQCTEKPRPSRFELPKKSSKKIITSASNLKNDSKETSCHHPVSISFRAAPQATCSPCNSRAHLAGS